MVASGDYFYVQRCPISEGKLLPAKIAYKHIQAHHVVDPLLRVGASRREKISRHVTRAPVLIALRCNQIAPRQHSNSQVACC